MLSFLSAAVLVPRPMPLNLDGAATQQTGFLAERWAVDTPDLNVICPVPVMALPPA